jgi:hypothetical protein
MKFKINPILQFAIAFVLALLVGVGYTYAQDDTMKKDDMKAPTKQVIKAAAQSSRGGGADPNIKSDAKPVNDPNAKTPPPPPEKSGQRGARGCSVDVNNMTAWFVDIYSNGIYVGTVGPWGNGWTYPPLVGSAVYGRANFTDGTWKYWGPRQFVCAQGGIYSWQLTP